MVELLFFVKTLQFGEVASVNLAFADDVEGHVCHTIDDTCICHHLSGYIVDNDVFVFLFQECYQ